MPFFLSWSLSGSGVDELGKYCQSALLTQGRKLLCKKQLAVT